MAASTSTRDDVYVFGRFKLATGRRLLLDGDETVNLGGRALDLLIALVSRPNDVVSKYDLIAAVWPDVSVDEGALRFHMANLRKALGEGRDGKRYIATVTGRGYCFVEPVVRDQPGAMADAPSRFPDTNLPGRAPRIIGREADIEAVATLLSERRFVTIVGTGGVGKTTLAVAVGHDMIVAFAGAVHLVDLSTLNDPDLLPTTVATMLGLSHTADTVAGLVAQLQAKRLLLILDTCEPLIDAAATLAAAIIAAAPDIHILATSRETLRADGEHVYNLAPLACPPNTEGLTAAAALTFPAAQLFLERAAAAGALRDLDDRDAVLVADICLKLDGVPLGIELAAARVGGHGLVQTAALLDQRLALLWPGLRTAPDRQKTLLATLDWSFEFLSSLERLVLRRLAVFVGAFTIEAAHAVVAGGDVDDALVFSAIDGLVAKSLVAVRPDGAMVRYRLLDTTRAYSLDLPLDDRDRSALSMRHARHYLAWLEAVGQDWPNLSSTAQRSLHLAGIANTRAALEWSLAPGGDPVFGVRLAAAAAPVFISMSLLTECHRWSARALHAVDAENMDELTEMRLQAALGVSLMFTRGGQTSARTALEYGLATAERLGDARHQLQVLGPLQMFHLRKGNFDLARSHAECALRLANGLEDRGAATMANVLVGISLHLGGDLGRADAALEAALRAPAHVHRPITIHLGFDGRILAGVIKARNLWLQGRAAEAKTCAERALDDARTLGHPLSLSIALIWAASVYLWNGDLDAAEAHIVELFGSAKPHDLEPHVAVGSGFQGELAARRGNSEAGIEALVAALEDLHAAPYELLSTPLNIALAQALADAGRHDEAMKLVAAAIASVEANGDRCYLPELLRVKAALVLASGAGEPEGLLRGSLDLSCKNGAAAWTLRTATDLSRLLIRSGRADEARPLLESAMAAVADGGQTADLVAAAKLVSALE